VPAIRLISSLAGVARGAGEPGVRGLADRRGIGLSFELLAGDQAFAS
jgi:hypothetical protein